MKIAFHGGHIFAIACAIGAAYVAASGHDGWGWLLVVALLIIPSFDERPILNICRANIAGCFALLAWLSY